MNSKNKNSLTDKDPYRFDITGDFIRDGHKKISAEKSRVQTEAKMKKENQK